MKRFKISVFFVVFFAALLALGQIKETISLLLALIVHEAGHIAAAKALGCKVEKLSIQPLGGYLYLDQLLEVQPGVESRIALAGPAANLLTAAAAMALAPYSPQGYVSAFIRASLTLMAFNLLPALPLDGGRVLRGRLTGWISYYRATKIVLACGFGCGLLLIMLAICRLAQGQPNPSIFAAAGFLLYNAWVERKQLLVPLLRYVLSRQQSLRKHKLMAADTLVAAPGAKVNEVLKHIRPQKYYQISVLDEKYALAGTLTEHQLLKLILAGTGQSSLQEAVKGLGERMD
ncbi:MAG: site-2 protease family protein [Eubacteriales bacterium]|jgi:stage IV sporulation protein FB|nr:site-2 protease family protein [Eubacteriales bacterium]